jgi:hypothetical protein
MVYIPFLYVSCRQRWVQTVITGQFSKSGTRTPLRECYVWWSQDTLCAYRLDKEDNRGCSLTNNIPFCYCSVIIFKFILTNVSQRNISEN